MAGAIPRLVRLLEDCPNLKFIHPFTEYSSVLCRYRTAEGKYALKTGALESELEENEYVSSLEPGALHVTNYFIGLQVDVDQGKFPALLLFFLFTPYQRCLHTDDTIRRHR